MIDAALFGYDGNLAASHANASAAAAGSDARRASRTAQQVEERHERLALVCMAMWSLILDKTDLTEQDLLERVKLIDQMDGQADGKAKQGIMKCTACHRTLSPRHQKCLYCGHPKLASSAFDLV